MPLPPSSSSPRSLPPPPPPPPPSFAPLPCAIRKAGGGGESGGAGEENGGWLVGWLLVSLRARALRAQSPCASYCRCGGDGGFDAGARGWGRVTELVRALPKSAVTGEVGLTGGGEERGGRMAAESVRARNGGGVSRMTELARTGAGGAGMREIWKGRAVAAAVTATASLCLESGQPAFRKCDAGEVRVEGCGEAAVRFAATPQNKSAGDGTWERGRPSSPRGRRGELEKPGRLLWEAACKVCGGEGTWGRGAGAGRPGRSAWAFVLGGAGAVFAPRGPGRTACELLPSRALPSPPPLPMSQLGCERGKECTGSGAWEGDSWLCRTAKSPAVVAGPRLRRHVAEGGGAGTWRRLRVLRPIVPN